jgi:hypothetical protein
MTEPSLPEESLFAQALEIASPAEWVYYPARAPRVWCKKASGAILFGTILAVFENPLPAAAPLILVS